MITSWNKSFNLPMPLAESISGYNRYTDMIWILGGWNGSAKTDSLWTFDTTTNEFTSQYYANKRPIAASSYTTIRDSMYFTNNYSLYELTMIYNFNYNPRLDEEDVLPAFHYADTPSITTDQQQYLFVTGGIVNNSIVNTLSIYDVVNTNDWISIPTPNMIYPRLGHNCIARNNYLYIFGGYINNTHTTNSIEKLYIGDIGNIHLQNWTLLNSTLNTDVAYMRIAALNGLIYIIGGYSESYQSSVQIVNVLDPTNDEIINGANLSHDTNRAAVTENINGNIYIFGGYSNTSMNNVLSIWQRSINDNPIDTSNDNYLWIFVIFGIIILVIASVIFIWYKVHKYFKRKTRLKNRRRGSYGGVEGKIDSRIVMNKYSEASVSRNIMDTASFQSMNE